MSSKPLNSEKANAVLVIALSGIIAAMVANGPGPLSLKQVVSGVLSNPIPRQAGSMVRLPGTPLQRAIS